MHARGDCEIVVKKHENDVVNVNPPLLKLAYSPTLVVVESYILFPEIADL